MMRIVIRSLIAIGMIIPIQEPSIAGNYGPLTCGGPGSNRYQPTIAVCFSGDSTWRICSGISNNAGDPNNGFWIITHVPCNKPAPPP